MKPVLFHRLAKEELAEAMAYYEQQAAGLGRDLQEAVERVVTLIQRTPGIGTPYKGTGFRRLVVRRFPYLVYYLEQDEAIWVAAVAHAKRRPDYWKRRKMQ